MPNENAFREILQGIAEDQQAAFNALPQEVRDRIAQNYQTTEQRQEASSRDKLLGDWAKFEQTLLPKYKDAFSRVGDLETQLQQSKTRVTEMESEVAALQAAGAGGDGDPAKIQEALANIRKQISDELKAQFVTSDQLTKAMKDTERSSIEFIHTRSLPTMQRADELVREAREKYQHDLDREKLFEVAQKNNNNLELAYRLVMDPVKEAFDKTKSAADLKAAEERGYQRGATDRETRGANPEASSEGSSFQQFAHPGSAPSEDNKIPDGYIPGQGDLIGRNAAANYRRMMEAGGATQ
jgi:hypothetical protein